MVQRADTPSSTSSEESSYITQEPKPQPSQTQPSLSTSPSEPLLQTITRFLILYGTSLLAFDSITAARVSPYSLTPPNGIPPEMRRTGQGEDYGEGESVGFRMDPGGRPRRNIGRINGGAGNIDVPACKGCKYSAAPTIG